MREQLETRFLAAEFNVEEEIRSNADTNLTYRGYVQLVDEDLKWGSNINEQVLSSPTAYKEVVQNVAKGMIRRLLVALTIRHPLSEAKISYRLMNT